MWFLGAACPKMTIKAAKVHFAQLDKRPREGVSIGMPRICRDGMHLSEPIVWLVKLWYSMGKLTSHVTGGWIRSARSMPSSCSRSLQ